MLSYSDKLRRGKKKLNLSKRTNKIVVVITLVMMIMQCIPLTAVARSGGKNISESSKASVINTTDSDTGVPTVPQNLRCRRIFGSYYLLYWDAAKDNVGIKGYEIYKDGQKIATTSRTNYWIKSISRRKGYVCYVKAYDYAGNRSEASKTIIVNERYYKDIEAPTAPRNLKSTLQTGTSISLTWDKATDNVGVVGYEIYQGNTLVERIPGTSYTVTGLEPTTEYIFTVKAYDKKGNISEPSNTKKVSTITVDTEAPTAPQDLQAKLNLTEKIISLTWKSSQDNVGVKGYQIYRNGQIIATTNKLAYIDKEIITENIYTYTIKAYDAEGNISKQSNQIEISTKDTEVPTVPQNVRYVRAFGSYYILYWDIAKDNVGVKGYEIYKDGQKIAVTSRTYCWVNRISPRKGYAFYVKAFDSVGNYSEASKTMIVNERYYKDIEAPTVPQNLRSTGETYTSVALAWDEASDNVSVTGYEIYQGEALVEKVAGTSYTVTGLEPGTEYAFVVKACDEAGNVSEASEQLNEITLLEVPINITTTETMNSVTVMWDGVVNAISYEVEADGEVIDNGAATSFEHQGLAVATEHTYRVRAKNAKVTSEWSETITKSTKADTEAPTVPQNLRSTEETYTSIALAWDEASDNVSVTGYEIYQGEALIEKVAGTSYTVTGLKPGTEYAFVVKACDEAGNVSEASEQITIKTYVENPIVVSVKTSTDGNKILVTFDKNMAMLPSAPAGFVITVNEIDNPISAVSLNSNKDIIEIFLTDTICLDASNIQLSYTAGTVVAADGGVLASFANKVVTNDSLIVPSDVEYTYTYDDMNRLINVKTSTGKVFNFQYDTNGNVVKVESSN